MDDSSLLEVVHDIHQLIHILQHLLSTKNTLQWVWQWEEFSTGHKSGCGNGRGL